MAAAEVDAIVLDSGSGLCKAGYAGDDNPIVVIPSVVGRSHQDPIAGMTKKDFYVGHEAQTLRGILTMRHPIERGVVVNWEDMETLWHHVFYNELRVSTKNRPVLLSEITLNPKANRDKSIEVMFETFESPAVYVANEAVLSMYAAGRYSGAVLDIGDGITQAVPIYKGYALHQAAERLNMAGHDLTDYLARLLTERGYDLTSRTHHETVQDMKEKLCYVALDFEAEMKASRGNALPISSYELPDGNIANVCDERFRCPEALFRPSLTGMEAEGIHKMVYRAIMKSGIDIRRDLYSNIYLCGGSSLVSGLAERLRKEISALAPSSVNVNVISAAQRQYSAWIGGSVMASQDTFLSMCISRSEYHEHGPDICHKKV